MKFKKLFAVTALVIASVFSGALSLYAQDTVQNEMSRKEIRRAERMAFRAEKDRFFFDMSYVYPTIQSRLSFELSSGLLSANIGLEKNLGLADHQSFFTASFAHRITPRSGIQALYYGIERRNTRSTQNEYIFLDDTIPKGTGATFYFNTHVISAGYLLTAIDSRESYLGFFFNLYLMALRTGVRSDVGNINRKLDLNLPLPSVGTIVKFNLNKWLSLDGTVGFFTLNAGDLTGNLFTLLVALRASPLDWLSININYQEFDVRAEFIYTRVNSIVEYKIRGPGIGVNFRF